MDGQRFDAITRTVATVSRRSLFRVLASGLASLSAAGGSRAEIVAVNLNVWDLLCPDIGPPVCTYRYTKPGHFNTWNGCGPEGNSTLAAAVGTIEEIWKVDFANAGCNQHDLCYGTCNSSRFACDSQLGPALRSECGRVYPDNNTRETNCQLLANQMVMFVEECGEAAYRNAQREACVCCPEGQWPCDDKKCCPFNALCVDGECQCPDCTELRDNTCQPVVCPGPCTECRENSCQPKLCGECQHCENDVCVDDASCCAELGESCADTICCDGRTCQGGRCCGSADESCANGGCCEDGHSCCNGLCREDCPAGHVRNPTTCECILGTCGSPTQSCSNPSASRCGGHSACVCRSGPNGTFCGNNNFTFCRAEPGCFVTGCPSGYQCVPVCDACPSGSACAASC